MKEIKTSQVDVLFSNGRYPIELLFYYKEGFETKRIRKALHKLSSVFWPMFGDYRDGRIFFDKYNEGDFYDENVVNQEFNIPEIGEYGFEVYSRFCLPDLKKLFFLKVIHLKNGLVLIPKMNHLTGDGYSYFYFLSVLATLAHPTRVPLKSSLIRLSSRPHHRRTILRDFSFRGAELEPEPPGDKFVIKLEEIPRKEVQSMIRDVASSRHLRISSNDVLSALAVKRIVGRAASRWEGEVHLTIPIDVRRQVKEYGRKFFGNGIMLHKIGLSRESVENSPAEEIAVKVRNSMPSLSKEVYIRYLTELEGIISAGRMDKLRPFDPGSGALVTNLSKLPADKLNFGTGCPELLVPLTSEKNSAAILGKKENFILRYAY